VGVDKEGGEFMNDTTGKCEKPEGLRKIGTFITADALLAAILLVWSQLWIHPSVELFSRFYQPGCGNVGTWFDTFNTSVGVGLAWSYLAVFIALVALASAGWRSLVGSGGETPDFAIGLFAASITMGAIEVFSSFVIVSLKAIQGAWIYKALLESPPPLQRVYVISMVLAAFIIALSIWGAYVLNKKGWCKYLPWLIEGVVILGVAAFILGCVWCSVF
jgi:hypothetical protein